MCVCEVVRVCVCVFVYIHICVRAFHTQAFAFHTTHLCFDHKCVKAHRKMQRLPTVGSLHIPGCQYWGCLSWDCGEAEEAVGRAVAAVVAHDGTC